MNDTSQHSGIEITGLHKRYDGVEALKGVTLSVPPGEIAGLIGPDGAGKTTAMKIICGLLRPDAGVVRVAGLDGAAGSDRVKKLVGYMPQRFSLYPDLTVSENLRFYADLFGISGNARVELESKLMSFSRLEPFRDRRAGDLSGGMKQKLALSCTLIHKPKVLLLDEPTTGVDVVSRREFWSIMRSLAGDGLALLVSTPYMDEAMLCDRIVLIRRGEVIASGTPDEVTNLFSRRLMEIRGAGQSAALARLRSAKGSGLEVHRFGDRLHVIYEAAAGEREIRAMLEGLDVNVLPIPPSIEDTFVDLTARAEEGGR
jgi:ABC-2 type transport system ATP-binding protein